MKTHLDSFYEVSLCRINADGDTVVCVVQPMCVDNAHRIVADTRHSELQVSLNSVAGFLVLPEVVQCGLGLELADTRFLTEAKESELSKLLAFKDFYPDLDIRHIVLKTSHEIVNVFLWPGQETKIHMTQGQEFALTYSLEQ